MITNLFSDEEPLQVITYDEGKHQRHTGKPVESSLRHINHRTRELAATTSESTRTVVRQAVDHLSTQEALIVLPNRRIDTASRNVQNQRQKQCVKLPIPRTCIFPIPEDVRELPNHENFFLGDWQNEEEMDRVLLMGMLNYFGQS